MKNVNKGLILCIMIFLLLVGILFSLGCFGCDNEYTKAHACSQNDMTTFESHPVTFVVVDTFSNPHANMRIEIVCDNKSMYNTTGINGSCYFVCEGNTKCVVTIYNENLDCEKEFKLYPIQSCYLVVL